MIALTVSDMMDANAACLRISELNSRKASYGVPDAICIRNDSFTDAPFTAMTELVSNLWDGSIVLESDDPGNISKAAINVMERKPLLIGANSANLEQFSMTAKMFDCPLCISAETLEELLDLVRMAKTSGVREIVLDPMMRNMKQCLEVCTDLGRLAETIPEADHPVTVRTWSGEYAMTMAAVSLLTCDATIIMDDLDSDSCETLSALVGSIR